MDAGPDQRVVDQDVRLGLTGQAPPLWGVAPHEGFESRGWDGELAVLVESTGETHRLDATACSVWQALRAQAGSFRSSSAWLQAWSASTFVAFADGVDDDPEADLEAFVGVLQELERIGLVSKAPA